MQFYIVEGGMREWISKRKKLLFSYTFRISSHSIFREHSPTNEQFNSFILEMHNNVMELKFQDFQNEINLNWFLNLQNFFSFFLINFHFHNNIDMEKELKILQAIEMKSERIRSIKLPYRIRFFQQKKKAISSDWERGKKVSCH